MRYVSVCLAFLWLLTLCACGGQTGGTGSPSESMEDNTPSNITVARINGDALSRGEYVYLLADLLEEYALYTGGVLDWDTEHNGQTAAEFFKSEALRIAVFARAVMKKAADYQVAVTEEDENNIRLYIEQEMDYLGGEEAFADYLRALGTDRETHELYNYRLPVVSEMLQDVLFAPDGAYAPSDEDIQSFYDDHFMTLSYIYLSALDPGGNPLESEDYGIRMAEAEALRAQAALGGDFSQLIRTHGEDYLMLLTPEGMVVPKGQNGEAFDTAAAILTIGELSPVVEDDAGFYIILRQQDDPLWPAENTETVLFEYRSHRYAALVEQWCDETTAELTDEYHAIDPKEYEPKG